MIAVDLPFYLRKNSNFVSASVVMYIVSLPMILAVGHST